MGLAHSPRIITDGLVLCLDAANKKSYTGSGTTWTDLSGNGNHSTLVNGVAYNAENGGYLSFDGVDDYTTIPVPSGSGSISFWYYYNANTYSKLIMGNGSSMLYCAGGESGAHWFNHSTDYTFFAAWTNTSQWLNIALVYDSNTSNRMYYNGKLVYSSTTYSIPKGTTYNVAGNYYVAQNCRFSNIQTYNRALSATEVFQNFNALRGRFGL